MQQFRVALRPVNDGLLSRFQWRHMARTLSTNMSPGNDSGDYHHTKSSESNDDFEQRIFGGTSGNTPKYDTFFQKLDRLERDRDRYDLSSRVNKGFSSSFMDDLDYDDDDSLSDGMDEKLMDQAVYFDVPAAEAYEDDYSFRPDLGFIDGGTYDTKDLDLTKPAAQKPYKKEEFEVTTDEVLRKADFRNVRFLANFITEAGLIIKRSQTRISAKAQRKVAREIKTARAFGLMPFTTMGTKHFVFGKTMEDLEEDFVYDPYDGHMTADANDPPRA